jgi:hypothetical protein
LREVAKPNYYYCSYAPHLIIFVTKSGSSDDTFKAFEPLLGGSNKPNILLVSDANLLEVINKILKRKHLYNDVKDQDLEDE